MTGSRGRFVWHELRTRDRTRATQFYTALRDTWETRDLELGQDEPYTLCRLGGKDFAGITKSTAPPHVPSHWLPYVDVEDVDAAAKRVTELGGTILRAAVDLPGIARFAVVADPQGAAFAVHSQDRPYPEEPDRPPVGAFIWDELLTSDTEAASRFYCALFGYAVVARDLGRMGTYQTLTRGARQTAGVMKAMDGVHPHWQTYLHVADVDKTTARATALGARMIVPPSDLPTIGRFSAVDDPTGAGICFFTPTER